MSHQLHALAMLCSLLLCPEKKACSQTSPLAYKKNITMSSTYDPIITKTMLVNCNRLKDSCSVRYLTEREVILNKMNKAQSINQLQQHRTALATLKAEYLEEKKRINLEIAELEDQIFYANMNGIFPAKNSRQAATFYNLHEGSFSLLNNLTFQYNAQADNYSVYNEVFSDFIGPCRIDVGGMFLHSPSMTEQGITLQNQIQSVSQLILGGGGNVVLGITYPIYLARSKEESFGLRVLFKPKIGVYSPALQANADISGYNLEGGIQVNGYIMSHNETFVLFFHNQSSLSRVELPNQFVLNQRKTAAFNQLTLGVSIKNKIRLGYNWSSALFLGEKTLNNHVSISMNPHF